MKKLVFSTLLLAFGANLAACQTTALDSAGPTASTGDSQSGALTDKEKDAFTTLTGYEYPSEIDGMLDFCEKNLPPAVVKTVPVKGYTDETCNNINCALRALSEGYQFVEFKNHYIDRRSKVKIRSQTKYRVSFAQTSSPKCNFWLEFIENTEERYRASFERYVPPGMCAVVVEIPSYTAKYKIQRTSAKRISVPNFSFNLDGEEVIDLNNNEVIGSRKAAYFKKDGEAYKASLHCGLVDSSLSLKVIPPIKNQPNLLSE